MSDIYLKVFLTNLGKYNEGELVGRWVDVEEDTDWQKELRDIGIYPGSMYEESFISDYETNLDIKIDEYISIDNLKEIAAMIDYLSYRIDAELFNGILKCTSDLEEAYGIVKKEKYRYYTNVSNDDDLGRALVDDGYLGYVSEEVKNYLDYDSIGYNYRIGSEGVFTGDSFVEVLF